MGRKITIIGADFSAAAVTSAEVEYAEKDLLLQEGRYLVSRTAPKELSYSANSSFRSALLPLHSDMYVENACALKDTRVGQFEADIPAIIFLSSDDISGYIQNSEVYPTSGGDTFWGVFKGALNPPAGATHVIIQTFLPPTGYGDLYSIISWNDTE